MNNIWSVYFFFFINSPVAWQTLDYESSTFSLRDVRDFKIQGRGRQREGQKNNRFNKQNNNFARASHFFVHFFLFFARLRRENV